MKNRRTPLLTGLLLAALVFGLAALFATRTAKGSAAETHRYMSEWIDQDRISGDQVQGHLDQAANDGWKLVSASNCVHHSDDGKTERVSTLLIFEKTGPQTAR